MYQNRRCLAWLMLLALLCCGCTREAADPLEQMAFPGTRWTMTPEELTEALELEERQYKTEYTEKFYVIGIEDAVVFGSPADVAFCFALAEDGTAGGLETVEVAYPDEADMEQVLANLTEEYGEPMPPAEDSSDGQREHLRLWESERKLSEELTPEELDILNSAYEEATGKEIDVQDSLYTVSLARIFWTDDIVSVYNFTAWQGVTKLVTFYCDLASTQLICEKLSK